MHSSPNPNTKQLLVQILRAHGQEHRCEALYTQHRRIDAAESLLEIVNTVSEAVRANKLVMDWIFGEILWHASDKGFQFLASEFTNRFISTLEGFRDEASNCDEALKASTQVCFM